MNWTLIIFNTYKFKRSSIDPEVKQFRDFCYDKAFSLLKGDHRRRSAATDTILMSKR